MLNLITLVSGEGEMDRKNLQIGDEVYWNDPDDGMCSGVFKIVEFINDTVVLLRNDSGSETEAFLNELS